MAPGAAPVHDAEAIGILGTGSCLPGKVVTNDEVGAPAGVTDEWITRKTAIRERRWAKADEATSDLAAMAARAALDDAGVCPADISLVVVATSTPDAPQPPTATAVAAELGVPAGTPAFDINAVCSGFVFALTAAERMIRGTGGHAVVIGADIYSRTLDPTDRRTVVLFGDGAGAVVLGPTATGGVLATELATFPQERDLIRVPAGGSRIPASRASVEEGLHYFAMDGPAVRHFVENRVGPLIRSFLDRHLADRARRAHFVPHQANGRMIAALADSLGFLPEHTHTTVRFLGNTGAASVPVTLDRAADRLVPGDLVVLAGFGGGMAAGLALVEWRTTRAGGRGGKSRAALAADGT
ncbi:MULTISPECIES: 3-oxoacyl-ACP synthase III family protein [Streptomyces]|uniref:Acetoacetyl-CoA synthase n=1 Tax=Streptomyces albus subsp. chlorinus TaxID=337066 RepID=A0A3G4YJU4_9ACTN|nr:MULTISPECIES: ketoacyl-ACP synthase III [Streptomyces]UZN59883.1 acetoacetyl-CoA synthase [Streptomyces albus subsp. chlorinus] [Streptomyces sp. GBA 94-10 4N24]WAE19996.1 acetoacetyl-CoA synthase [Streptomyces albus subsp. chlorinus] [Streptomyces albidoflavus]AYV61414.1 acetoacetyl-CoA synthase [Streptomyces albus subsp. chlorinus]NSC25062.1 ketoacyl-ACP synthase III [Streptomyces albus subsp. chlorinus]UZN60207.1 acetoacetyl-CoA synthase [Streptomyces albus subsp. chlorinus] [Streptomyce